ncbi:hypothetical protein [Nocardia sp. NPDC020380]|uniref:hypothetical protein n=1 Tax=Nocardia sp. NPDC020380 TaxID=3364309 RepID=UPI0037B193E5
MSEIDYTELPFIDEHRRLVAAPPAAVWAALTDWIAGANLGVTDLFADLVGTEPRRASGTIPEVGATLPGFAITESVPDDHLTLTGRHRFSRYALIFSVRAESGGTVLSARSYAEFPGLHGRLYRTAVITSGAHRILVRQLLARITHSLNT